MQARLQQMRYVDRIYTSAENRIRKLINYTELYTCLRDERAHFDILVLITPAVHFQSRLLLSRATYLLSLLPICLFDSLAFTMQVVQLYVSWAEATIPSLPKLQLVAFKRIEILPSRSETVTFAVQGLQLMVWVDTNTGFKVLPGKCCMAFLKFHYNMAQKATLQQHHFCHALMFAAL